MWYPSHVDPEDPSLTPQERLYATGNGFADSPAGEAAGFSCTNALAGARPPDTDLWDCTALLVQRRAAQAMVDSTTVAPWTAERPPAARQAPKGLLDSLRKSEHCLVKYGHK